MIHGMGGVGKSSFAASCPKPFFLDTEGSTEDMDVSRAEPETFSQLMEYLTLFYTTENEYKTVVLDTVDWAERMAQKEVCDNHNIEALSQLDYGRGYDEVNHMMQRVASALSAIQKQGKIVIVLAHSEIVKYSNPLGTNYDIIRIKMRDKTSDMFRELVKLIGYMHRPVLTSIDKKAGGFQEKIRAINSYEPVISCVPNAAYDAKNRFGIKNDINVPLENGWDVLNKAIKGE